MPRTIFMSLCALLLAIASLAQDTPALNVNSKYIVETVEFRYARKPSTFPKPALAIRQQRQVK